VIRLWIILEIDHQPSDASGHPTQSLASSSRDLHIQPLASLVLSHKIRSAKSRTIFSRAREGALISVWRLAQDECWRE
jgi:hypothetical protein